LAISTSSRLYAAQYKITAVIIFFMINFLSSLPGSLLYSQSGLGSLKGKITSEKNEALIGTNVRIIELNTGSSSDKEGKYNIEKIPEGIYTVEFSMIGFKKIIKEKVEIKNNEYAILNIILQEKIIESKPVYIMGSKIRQAQDDTRTSVIKIQPSEAKTLAGAGEDVLRTLQSLPGVLPTNDFTSQLTIRGGGPDQNLIIMDDIEIFNPYRLYGMVSMFNPETVSDITLITGGFTAKYGDRLSAVIDVENREGRKDKYLGFNVNANVTNVNLVLDGKLPDKLNGSWILSGRRTYYDLILGPIARNMGLVSGDVAFPNFSDLQTKIAFIPFESHKFIINGVLSRDATNIITGSNSKTPDSIGVNDEQNNYVLGLSWQYTRDTTFFSKLTISYYKNDGLTELNAKVLDPALDRKKFRDLEKDDTLWNLARFFSIGMNSGYSFKRYSLNWESMVLNDDHIFNYGAGFDFLRTDIIWEIVLSKSLKEIVEKNPMGVTFPDRFSDGTDYYKYHLFLSDNYKLEKNIILQPGLRFDYYKLIEKYYFSPRISASYIYDPITTFRMAWGIYYQAPGYEKLFDQNSFFDLTTSATQNLEAEKATHYIAGLERWLDQKWRVKGEIYYKKLSNIIVQEKRTGGFYTSYPVAGKSPVDPKGWTTPVIVIKDSLTVIPVNGSDGESYGFEILLEKKNLSQDDKFSGWFSYALAYAKRYRDGYSIPFNYDQRHTINIIGSYKLSESWDFNFRWTFGSNFPYTPPVGIQPRIQVKDGIPEIATDYSGKVILTTDFGDEENINSAQKPIYHKLDIRATHYTNFWNMNWTFYLDIINVYNHKNVFNYRYKVDDRGNISREEVNMLPVIPTFGFSARI
jgi:hypothetical protein